MWIGLFICHLFLQVVSATWALENNCAVVIANGEFKESNLIRDIVSGRRIGTFFTQAEKVGASIEDQAAKGWLNLYAHV